MPNRSSDSSGLRRLPARAIVTAIADAAERWRDADFPPRVRVTAALEARTGYTVPMIDLALDRLFEGLTNTALEATIRAELGSLDTLDAPIDVPGRPRAWARGVERVTILSSATTIGVAIPALAFALCAKSSVTVKDRSDGLVAAFVATLGEERPEILDAVTVKAWVGGDDAIEREAIEHADVVLVFGNDDTVRTVRAKCAADASVVSFGNRASAGYVGADALGGDLRVLADAIALDALLYDGDGCLSLHLLFVEANEERCKPLVEALGTACARVAVDFPMGVRSAQRSATTVQYANAAAFRAANGHGSVVRSPDGHWSVILAPPRADMPPLGGGTIPIYPIENLADACEFLSTHRIPLQAIGIAGNVDPCAIATELGAVRVAPIGRLQDPPLAGHHGGRARIADFIRWIDLA